ncbi:MAG: hypothetical protein JRJ45_00300 [Deltaproteobacteria bacterium]|nr:hypothetical protein [Deltaproteobacteria bacterium]
MAKRADKIKLTETGKTYFDVYRDARRAAEHAAFYTTRAKDLMIKAEKMRLFNMGVTG